MSLPDGLNEPTKDKRYLKARQTANSHSLLCNVSWRGEYMPRKMEASYLWVEGRDKLIEDFPFEKL